MSDPSDIVIYFPDRMLSLNNSHGRTRDNRTFKKTTTRQWEMHLQSCIELESEALENFRVFYDSSRHYLIINHYYFIPPDIFYTKNNKIRKKNDICNAQKLVNDTICNTIGVVDDGENCQSFVYKFPSIDDNWRCNFEVKIGDRTELEQKALDFSLIFEH